MRGGGGAHEVAGAISSLVWRGEACGVYYWFARLVV
jgi:hypothetical protein